MPLPGDLDYASLHMLSFEGRLRLAQRRVDLGARYTLSETRYEGPDLSKPVEAKPAEAPRPKAAAPAAPALPPANFPSPTPE